jgi:hypothetical protein
MQFVRSGRISVSKEKMKYHIIRRIKKINKYKTMANYFNSLPLRLQLEQLGVCEFMDQSEFVMV